MSYSISNLSIIFIFFNIIMSIIIPILLSLILHKKFNCNYKYFFIGCTVFIIFSGVLEKLVHFILLNSSFGVTLQNNIILWAVYGGLMAGLFEESGRLFAFKSILNKKNVTDTNALMYGVGHGGIEFFLVLGVTMINNLVYSILINTGNTDIMLSSLDVQQVSYMKNTLYQLSTTSSFLFLISFLERISAFILQISLSVIVWFSLKNNKNKKYFPLAILIHFFVDMISILLIENSFGVIFIESLIFLLAVLVAFFAKVIWEKNKAI